MFARTTLPVFRGAAKGAPVKQNIRRYTTPADPAKKSSSGVLYAAAVLSVLAGGGAYYYYYTSAPRKPLIKDPEILFKGGERQKWVDLKLADIHQVTHNTKLLRFALPSDDGHGCVSGLEPASAVLTKYQGPNDKEPTIRPYTPVNDWRDRGHMDLLVKKYKNGPMSTHLHNMNIGQSLSFKGPIPKYKWNANKHDHISLIAGGTGITPMYQLISAIFKDPEDKTKVTLVFGNISEDDILLKEELAVFVKIYPERFKVLYVLDKAPKDAGWAAQGYITKELLKAVLPEPGSGNNKIFVCGPPGMYTAISGRKKSPSDQGEVSGILKELGYSKDDVYKF